MKRSLRSTAVAAIAVIPWLPGVATGSGVASGGKAGSISARTAKGSSLSQHCDVRGVRSFGGFRHFGSTSLEGPSFLIIDAVPAEAQVFLDGRLFGSAAELLARVLPVAPGRHSVQVVAPGFTSHNVQVVADPNFSTRLRIALSLEGPRELGANSPFRREWRASLGGCRLR